jgi:hypothetical protein
VRGLLINVRNAATRSKQLLPRLHEAVKVIIVA